MKSIAKKNPNLEKAMAYTTSSMNYKDAYNPNANIGYKIKNKIHSFFSIRNIENEFVDF